MHEAAPRQISGSEEFAKFLATPVALADLLSQFVPPKHFANARFTNFEPDPAFPSQRIAIERVLDFVRTPLPSEGFLKRFGRRLHANKQENPPLGMYLDGGFGVGKTHLLAASYHEFQGRKAYLSFQELMFLVGLQTLAKTIESFSEYEMVFLDEFELDDPANTRIASNLVGRMMEQNVRMVTTSNTPPGALGETKFSVADFARELHELALNFETIRIDGEDYRSAHEHREETSGRGNANVDSYAGAELGNLLRLEFSDLTRLLSTAHPMRVRNVLTHFAEIELENVQSIESQNVALRFVYFLDKAYDNDLKVRFSPWFEPVAIFSSTALKGGDMKKYRRSISRLQEMTKLTRW